MTKDNPNKSETIKSEIVFQNPYIVIIEHTLTRELLGKEDSRKSYQIMTAQNSPVGILQTIFGFTSNEKENPFMQGVVTQGQA